MSKFCCTNCFSEPNIKKFIENNDTLGNCNYCKSTNVNISNVNKVDQFIMEGIERYYEDAANQVGYESAEGGYLLSTSDISDILIDEQEIFGEILDDPSLLLEDLVSNDGTSYVRKDPYGPPSGHPEEIRHWENFCKVVKNEQRFTTFLSLDDDLYDDSKPANFLFHLAKHFIPDLITTLPPTTRIFRARIEEKNKIFNNSYLTSPPIENAKNNRMSPAGISFFYGGMEPETCIHEVRPDIGENIIVGEFEVIKDLVVIDLSSDTESSEIGWSESIFDPYYSFNYEEFFKPFIIHFGKEISKNIQRNDNEIEYVPTQILTEFLKNINFKEEYFLPDGNNSAADVFLNGILFKSSTNRNGRNIALFRGPDISSESRETENDPWLLFKDKKIYQVTEIIVNSTHLSDETLWPVRLSTANMKRAG